MEDWTFYAINGAIVLWNVKRGVAIGITNLTLAEVVKAAEGA